MRVFLLHGVRIYVIHNCNKCVLDLSHFRPVYAPKDFLEVIISLKNPNYFSLMDDGDGNCKDHWGLIQVPLEVSSLKDLVRRNS